VAIYDDGHSYCFVCKEHVPHADATGLPKEDPAEAIPEDTTGAFRPIKSRGLFVETCKHYGYAVDMWDGKPVHIAPYRKGGEVVAKHIRFAEDKEFIWQGEAKGVELFGQHLWKSGGKRVIITEGEIDCLSVAQTMDCRWPVVSLPSGAAGAVKALTDNLEWVESFGDIILAFDDDKAGHEAIAKTAPLFTPGKVRVMRFDGCKDANEMLKTHGAKKLLYATYNAESWRPDGIVNGKDLLSVLLEKPEPGIDIVYPKLSELHNGFTKKRIYLFTGPSGMGKSTAVHEIAHDLAMRHGAKVGILALEDSLREAAMRHLAIAKNLPPYQMDELEPEVITALYRQILSSGNFHFYNHWGSSAIDVLLGKVRYLAVGEQCEWVVLDHINIVVSGLDIGGDERKTIDVLMTKLRSLVEETGIGLLAIAHLKRPQGTGKTWAEGRKPSLTDLRGSAALEQLSDSVIGIWNDPEMDESHLLVLKNRRTGKKGEADTLKYNYATGRLRPIVPEFPEIETEENNDF
jgi:twinkle protein